MATLFLHLARCGKVLSPVTLVPLPSPRPLLPLIFLDAFSRNSMTFRFSVIVFTCFLDLRQVFYRPSEDSL